MKIRKEALRSARLLFKASVQNGRVDGDRVKELTGRMITEKPRGYIQILEAWQKLIRLELEKSHAVVESSQHLSDSVRDGVLSDLARKFGSHLTSEFKVNPELLGGLRVKLGSTIWDGSLRTRLETLRQSIGA